MPRNTHRQKAAHPWSLSPVEWPYNYGMATMTIRSTYALDVDTVRTLEETARRWGVSKSEALRRAIRAAAGRAPEPNEVLAALEALQESLGLSSARAAAWARRTHLERRAASRRGQGGAR